MYIHSLVPIIAVCMYIYILTKGEFISSCSRPAISSNIVQITRATFFVNVFKEKWPPVAILDVKISLCIAFLTISDQYHNFYFVNLVYKMAAGGHFGCPKITFGRISGNFRSIRNFFFKLQNGRRRPSWMSEIHFRSHFWPFQIDTQLCYFLKFLTKWLPSAILDVRNSLWITFLAILDQ